MCLRGRWHPVPPPCTLGCPKGTSPQGAEHPAGPGMGLGGERALRGDSSARCHPASGATLPCCHLAPGHLAEAIPGVPGWLSCPAPSPAGSASSLCHRLGPGTVAPPCRGHCDPPGTARPPTQPPLAEPTRQLVGSARGPASREPTPDPRPSPPTPRHPDLLHLNPQPLRPLIFHGFQQHDFFQHHFMAGGL